MYLIKHYRKSININGNIEGIFSLVNYRRKKIIKIKQIKNDDVLFLPTELLTE